MKFSTLITLSTLFLVGCPLPLPELKEKAQDEAKQPAVTAFSPQRGFAANSDGFAGTQVTIDIENFPEDSSVEVIFNGVTADAPAHQGQQLVVRVPIGTPPGPGLLEVRTPGRNQDPVVAAATDPFQVMAAPRIDFLEPALGFAPLPEPSTWPNHACLANVTAASELPTPLLCSQFGDCAGGSCIALLGESLGIDASSDYTPEVSFFTASGQSTHYPAQVLFADWDLALVCVPPETWNAADVSWNIELKTPAGETQLNEGRGLRLPGCPNILGIDPPAAYQNGIATIFGNGFVPQGPMWVQFIPDSGTPFPAEVLAVTERSITIKADIPPEVTVPPGEISSFWVVVATPAGRDTYSLPFLVMGLPVIDAVTPQRVFATPGGAWSDNTKWTVQIMGSGFDISSTAANIVEFHQLDCQQDCHRANAQVTSASPMLLEVEVPEGPPHGLVPGYYRITVTTTAGTSPVECRENPDEQHWDGNACVRILGAPRLEEYIPTKVAWGDAVGLSGGPFDVLNPQSTSVTWTHNNSHPQPAEVLSVREDRLLVRVNKPPCDNDGGCPYDAGEGHLGAAMPLDFTVQTSAGTSETGPELVVIANTEMLRETEVIESVLEDLGGENWLPYSGTTSSRSPFFFFITNNKRGVLIYSTVEDPSIVATHNNGQLEAIAATTFGYRLLGIYPHDNDRVLEYWQFGFDGHGGIRYGNSMGLGIATPMSNLGLNMANTEAITMAAGRATEAQGHNAFAVVTEVETTAPACTRRVIHLFDVFGADHSGQLNGRRRCSIPGFYAQQLFFTENQQGEEKLVAEIDLHSGCTTYRPILDRVDAGVEDSGQQPLDWACQSSADDSAGNDRVCLALVEFDCDADGQWSARPLINGLPLDQRSSIRPTALGQTGFISAGNTGAMRGEWGKGVDLEHQVFCDEVLSNCDPSQDEEASFIPPSFISNIDGVSSVVAADSDTVFALGITTGSVGAQSHRGTFIRAERYGLMEEFTTVTGTLGPMAGNGFGALAFWQTVEEPHRHSIVLRRPASIRLNRFSIKPIAPPPIPEVGVCQFESRVNVLPHSARIIETGCADFGHRPCAAFIGHATMRVFDHSNACTELSDTGWWGWMPVVERPWCLDIFGSSSYRTMAPLMSLRQNDQPEALELWDDRICVVTSRWTNENVESVLNCVSAETACTVEATDTAPTPVSPVEVSLGVHIMQPKMTTLPGGQLLITDGQQANAAVVRLDLGVTPFALVLVSNNVSGDLFSGVSSVLVRRDRNELLAASSGALWQVRGNLESPNPAENSVHFEHIFEDEMLPPVELTLVDIWTGGPTFLYGGETPDYQGPRALWALDLDNHTLLGEVVSLEGHTDAILSRHGRSELLLGRQSPAGISSLNLAGTLRSFAALPGAFNTSNVESLWMTTDGRILLVVDNNEQLFFVF